MLLGVAERFDATPFDVEDVFWSHRGERCTFDTMIEEFGLRTDPLGTAGGDRARRRYRTGLTLRPRRRACWPPRSACRACISDDLAQLEAGMLLYDAFYRWCRDATEETHNWPTPRQSVLRGQHGRSLDLARSGRSSRYRSAVLWPRRSAPGAKIGVLSFGGPTAQIALMHRVIVDEKKWLDEAHYLNALSFCMLLPGPEAMQLAAYAGWRLHGLAGGLAAGLLFVLPGAAVVLALSMIYAAFGQVPHCRSGLFRHQGGRADDRRRGAAADREAGAQAAEHWAIAALSFVAIFFLALPFPLIVFAAALFGFFRARHQPQLQARAASKLASLSQTLRTIADWLAIWLTPLLALAAIYGARTISSRSSAGSFPSWPW